MQKWYCCHTTSFFLKSFVSEVGDITTILGFFFFSFCQEPCISCGEKLSAFFVLRSIGAATELSRTSLKHQFDIHKRATAQALLLAHASPEVLPNPVSNGHLSLLMFASKMVAPVLTTAMEPLTAMICTFNHFPEFRRCWILLGSSCQ